MSLRHSLTFAGYDREKSVVLLKGAFGALYPLQPTRNDGRRVMENVGACSESEFIESVCSDSYVSSGSSVKSCTVLGGEVRDGKSSGDRVADGGCRRSDAFLPVHGTVLTLKKTYRSGAETLPFAPMVTNAAGDVEGNDYHFPVLLGYDGYDRVFILPAPRLALDDGIWIYRGTTPLVELSFSELQLYYSWEDDGEIDVTCESRLSSELPLGEDCMRFPRLERAPLRDVFGVSEKTVYYLSAWSTYVHFVGVAWGFVWARLLPIEDVISGAHIALRENDRTTYIEPLPYCHSERSLCGVYGLCECEQGRGVPTTHLTPSSQSTDVEDFRESWRYFLHHIQNIDGVSARAQSSYCAFTPHGVFSPRGSNYAAQLNKKSADVPPLCSLLFVRANKVYCRGAFGVALECDVTPESLAQFGVLHCDRLVGTRAKVFEGRRATVLGVHMGCLVVTLDGDRRATILRGVKGKDELQVLFLRASSLAHQEAAEEQVRIPASTDSLVTPPLPTNFGMERDEKRVADVERPVTTADADIEEEEEPHNENRQDDRGEKEFVVTGAPCLLFTNFLKAVAFWRLRLLSEKEQLHQPLAFVKYYETCSRERMMEAVALLQKHRHLLGAEAETSAGSSITEVDHGGSSLSVQRIVQVLVEIERKEQL